MGVSNYRRLAPQLVAALCLAACVTGHGTDGAADRWQSRSDGRAPGMGETSDCRTQASRLAAARYPDQAQRSPDGTVYYVSNADRFAAEIRLYESCLQRRGYERPSPTSSTN